MPCDAGAPAVEHSAAGTQRFHAAYLTVWACRKGGPTVHERPHADGRSGTTGLYYRSPQAYDDAGVSGLCHEGRWEYAVDAMRGCRSAR